MNRNYLHELPSRHRQELHEILATGDALLASQKKGVVHYRNLCQAIADLRAHHLDFHADTVTIGQADELSEANRALLHKTLKGFMPWRKGPFNVFGIEIDAEWRSQRKWQRLLPVLPDLTGQVVADIGCNNGYYMFRMVPHQPRLVLGFEPLLHHHFTFRALNNMAGCANLHSELLGVEHLGLFEKYFDTIFLMGILYHRISPVEVLKDCLKALKPGGTLIVESQAIPGDQTVALFPETTYGKAPGTWFVPTGPCLVNWLKRAGFAEVELFCQHPMDDSEQHRTEWMTFESYPDFLDPTDTSKTIEGYPAPWRVFVKAVK
ncbi:MAG: tRNA 5-methoxyuridine(34)/uridine 5-oxyacetic acid(34) synthase CmoB [Desulfobulbaceae bacterium]|nr:tRNA 5-methoxyuridine(34)/uridine 5-oxyacetic acid(34) synthase CmoB [Desulfobulbaceae bacterium]